MVLRATLVLVTAGLAIELPLALWSKRVAAAMVQNLSVPIVWPTATAAVLLIGVALVRPTCRPGARRRSIRRASFERAERLPRCASANRTQ